MACVFLLSISLITISTPLTSFAADKVYSLRLASWWPRTHIMVTAMEAWIKDIETETGGRVKVTHFPSGQLATDKEGLEKLRSGIIDMSPVIIDYHQAELPASQVNSMPLLFTDAKHAGRVMNKMKNRFDSEFEANSAKLLWAFTGPPVTLQTARKPVLKLEDWKGFRTKVAGNVQAEVVKALGGVPVVIFAGEFYSSLQRGTIDGMLMNCSASSAFKLQEVISHVIEYPLNVVPIFPSMNLNVWKSLPKEIQDKMMVANEKAVLRTCAIYHDAEIEASNAWKKLGIKFHTLPHDEMARWKEAIEPIWKAWIKEKEAKGLPAKKLAEEAQRLAATYK